MRGISVRRGESPHKVGSLFVLFAIEGALLQFSSSINGFGNNLFATNLGATDAQIGMVQMTPNLLAMLLLLPLGIAADRAKSSRTVPLCMLLLMTVGYLIMGCVPMAGDGRMALFFIALACTVGGMALYNAQWQNFFGDAVQIDQRNAALTLRNRTIFVVGIIAPIVCGVIMGTAAEAEGKLRVLQAFYFICAAVSLTQAAVLLRMDTPVREAGPRERRASLRSIGETVRVLARDRSFMLFFVPVVLFYMTWQFDWSMWYIGQVQYLGLTETELSIYIGTFNVGQLFAVGIMSRVVRRRGTDYAISWAALGLVSCPLIMVSCVFLPPHLRMGFFTVLMTVLDGPQCAVGLCVVQILLRVAPKQCRALAVSLFTLTTVMTNCCMPFLGVQLYTLLGADLRALLLFNALVFVLRVGTWLLLLFRWRRVRAQEGAPGLG